MLSVWICWTASIIARRWCTTLPINIFVTIRTHPHIILVESSESSMSKFQRIKRFLYVYHFHKFLLSN